MCPTTALVGAAAVAATVKAGVPSRAETSRGRTGRVRLPSEEIVFEFLWIRTMSPCLCRASNRERIVGRDQPGGEWLEFIDHGAFQHDVDDHTNRLLQASVLARLLRR